MATRQRLKKKTHTKTKTKTTTTKTLIKKINNYPLVTVQQFLANLFRGIR